MTKTAELILGRHRPHHYHHWWGCFLLSGPGNAGDVDGDYDNEDDDSDHGCESDDGGA